MAGMDDEDIEEALARMDGRRTTEPEQPGTWFPKIRPGVDRDFAERMFKMFARPFDPNWQMPDLDGPGYIRRSERYGGYDGTTLTAKPGLATGFAPALGTGRRQVADFNPGETAWKPDWDGDGKLSEEGPRTKLTSFMPQGPVSGRDSIQLTSGAPAGGELANSGGEIVKYSGAIGPEFWKKGAEVAKEVIKLDKFGQKAYKAAIDQEYTHDEAMQIARDAQWMYGAYRASDWAASAGLLLTGKERLKWTGPIYVGKEGAKELYVDELDKYIIEQAINNRKRPWLPPEASTLPP